MSKERIHQKTITQHIEGPYREYALYTLESRGIPNFYDSLTNVQRLILLHCPSNFTKTAGVVGQVFATGLYHHGDGSLTNVINRLAKPVGISHRILDGDGFFGSPAKNEPAAARYTKVKISPLINKIINENKMLNHSDSEGNVAKLNVEFPIGLVTHILGIAVGYSTNILPRKVEEIHEYLDGKRKEIHPYFSGFKGTVEKYQRGWIITGICEINDRNRTIKILELPPIIKYETFLAKLSAISEEIPMHVENKTTYDVNLTIRVLSQNVELFDKLKKAVLKALKIGFTENLTFIRDGRIIQYEKVEDYLDDFWFVTKDVKKRKIEWDIQDKTDEISFLSWKIKFIDWVIKKKSGDEPEKWLSENPPKDVQVKLARVTAKELTVDNIKKFTLEISSLEKEILILNKNLESLNKEILKKQTGYISKAKVTINKELVDFDAEDVEEYVAEIVEEEN